MWWKANVSTQQNTYWQFRNGFGTCIDINLFSTALFTDFCLVWRSKVRAHINLPVWLLRTFTHIVEYEIWVFSKAKLIFIFIHLVLRYFLCVCVCTMKTHCISTCNATRFDSDQTCLWHHHIHDVRYGLSNATPSAVSIYIFNVRIL